MTRFTHPTGLELSQFADADLPTGRRREIDEHLDACGACGQTVDFFLRLSACAADLPGSAAPDVAAAVLRRRAAGERIALDVEGVAYS